MSNKMKAVVFVTASILFICGIFLCIPSIQLFLIDFAEKLLGRALNSQEYLISLMLRFAIFLFSAFLLDLWLYYRTTEKYQSLYNKNSKKIDCAVSIGVSLFFLLVFILPFVIFGQNSVITIHDNLDGMVGAFHYIHSHNLFWKFNENLPVFNGISSLLFNTNGFSLCNALLCLLPTYTGYVVNYILCIFLGFFCMFFMQRIVFKDENIILITFTSLSYALLPSFCTYRMGTATLPFAFILFYKLLTTREKKWYAFSFLYPFVSEFSSVGLFVCGFWLIALIVVSIRQRRLNFRLFLGFLIICFAFLVVISNLIYMRFVIHEPLNRDFMTGSQVPFIRGFISYFFSGYYHSATLQNRLVDWVILGVSICIIVRTLKNKQFPRNKIVVILLICISIELFCSIIAALSDAKIMDKIIKVVFPPLAGVSFSRIFTISRVLCYVAFTASLLFVEKNKKYLGFSYALAVLQLVVIFIGNPQRMNPLYADSEPTWRKNLIGSEDITWKEFYSEELFTQIKKSIGYKEEPVCAVGYHPSVLLYNDFTTIDGYISVYPYNQQLLWHDLMKPEFDRNPEQMRYFDSWGGRRYVYNKDLSYQPAREKYHEPVDLYIDMNILKNDYQCKYILSRAELSNADELGLKHRGTFDLPESIYVIWVYEVE